MVLKVYKYRVILILSNEEQQLIKLKFVNKYKINNIQWTKN